ncbi:MAG: hypothetical protein NTY35_05425 [Planctomycetota bacterium]|nr:hypothetical protein [Planctomycetota bacterium]
MSAQTAENPHSLPSGGALIAVALGLMVLAGVTAFLLLGTGGPIDGRARMVQAFGVADLPFALQIASATKMSSGGELVVYETPGAPVEPARPEPEGTAKGVAVSRVDWSKVEIPEASGAPRQASFLFVPGERGRSVLEEMIREVRGKDRTELDDKGGTVLVGRGKLDFRGWDSDWIHLRTYEPGGTFRDAMRISLSTPEDPCVLTATWPRGTPAAREQLEELVKPLVAKPR